MHGNDMDEVAFAREWIACTTMERHEREHRDRDCATDQMYKLVRRDPERAWRVIHAIRAQDGSDDLLANLAAGPLEDLMVYHGPAFISRVEALSRQDAQFRKLLGAVWRNDMTEDVWRRLSAASYRQGTGW